MCVCERERESVCVCERERVCVCVCVREKECVCVCVWQRCRYSSLLVCVCSVPLSAYVRERER